MQDGHRVTGRNLPAFLFLWVNVWFEGELTHIHEKEEPRDTPVLQRGRKDLFWDTN